MRRLIAVICLCGVVVMSGVPGGKTEQNPSDPEFMTKAWKATKGINDDASNNGPYHMIPIKVVSVTSQVVAGVSYDLVVEVGEGNCKKGDLSATEITQANCQLREGGNRALYSVNIWEKPWENFEQFTVKKIKNLAPGESASA